MFKIISAVFSTGFAVGAASAVFAIHRGHIELAGNQPHPARTDDIRTGTESDADNHNDNDASESGNESGLDVAVAAATGREVS